MKSSVYICGGIVSLWLGSYGYALAYEGRVLQLAGDNALTLGAGMTSVIQSMDDGTTDDSGLTYSVDLVFEGDFGEKGTALIYINTAQGEGISPTIATGVNADNETGDLASEGYSETRIAEAWYQYPVSTSTSITVGKIDPSGIYDHNHVANDETSQFLSDSFVNNPAIAFPGYTGGISLAIHPSETVGINFGVFESAGDFAGSLDSSFVIGELGIAQKMGGQPGNIRLSLWNEDTASNKGVAINMDQSINDSVTLMLRYGTQEDTEPFDAALSIGGQWAVGSNMIGAGYSQLSATATGADDETHLEIYYNHAVTDHLHLTGDVQMIANPDFNGNADDVTVYGLRAQLDI